MTATLGAPPARSAPPHRTKDVRWGPHGAERGSGAPASDSAGAPATRSLRGGVAVGGSGGAKPPGLVTDDSGSAVLIALLTTFLLGSIAAGLILITSTETLIAGAHRHAEETACAADAAFELTLHDLAVLSSWTPVLASPPANTTSSYSDGRQVATPPDGRVLDLSGLTAERQRESDLVYGPGVFGGNSPRWRLYLHTSLESVLPSGTAAAPAYLLAWVADDGGEEDGDPTADSNGRLLVHAEAYGAGGARRAIEGAIGRTPGAGALQVLSWREFRP